MASWAAKHIEKLKNGERVTFRPRGNSMRGRVESGQLVTVTPDLWDLVVGDIVLCTVNGRDYLHQILAIRVDGDKRKYKIGNNLGGVNGWIPESKIYGVKVW